MILSSLTRIDKNARRLNEILAILGRYGLAVWFSKLPYEWIQSRLVAYDGQTLGDLTKEAKVRLALAELGTTFIKLGQILSTREDLIGPALASELKQLQAQTNPDPPEIVRRTIQEEFGASPEELFLEFEETAFASASIGQVHRALLEDGRRVIVKVQHEGIQDKIIRDLDLMMGLAELLQKHVEDLKSYQPVATIREFRRSFLRELDFTSERRNIQTFTANFAQSKWVHFPVVYPELSSSRVLTMELLEGIPGSNYEGLHASGLDLHQVATRAADMYLDMIFRDGFYHADPHPGNFVVLPGGVVGVIDCGMVGRVDEVLREEFESLLLAVGRRDAEGLTQWVLRLSQFPPEVDHGTLRAEINDLVADYAGVSFQDFDLSGAVDQLSDIVRRYGIVLPPSLSMLLKTLVMLEGTARQLNPSFTLSELVETYQKKLVQSFVDPQRWLRKAERAYHDWDRLLKVLPASLADILATTGRGGLEFRHRHVRLEDAVYRLVEGILAAALFVGAAILLCRSGGDTVGLCLAGAGTLFFIMASALALRIRKAIRKAEKNTGPPGP